MEENRAQKFLKEIQALDEPTKNRVLIIATVVIMIVVLFVWIVYFNSIVIPSAAETSQTAATSTAATQVSSASVQSSPGLWKGLESGFTSLFHGGNQVIQPSH